MQPDQNPLIPKPTPSTDDATSGSALAADVIRGKIANLYGHEPNAKEEQKEAELVHPRSKHQQFMHELTNSGKSLAEIQTAWHNYYINLPDDEKHVVWQEFYANHSRVQDTPQPSSQPDVPETDKTSQPETPKNLSKPLTTDKRNVGEIKKQLLGHINAKGKLSTKHHIQSLLFGAGIGSIIIVIFLFGFFNERFIAPFITPSRAVSETPIIVDPNNTSIGKDPKVIIPKINVEVPVVYDEPSIEEEAIQNALERGVVHYATTPSPGEKGNAVIFGHSSNNILNRGKYKFAFVLLSRLQIGDTFMLNKDGRQYVYKVYERKVVPPTDISVLGKTDKVATATLITCDPPGTSINRLVVIGEQISPDPSGNTASTAIDSSKTPEVVPSNAPSLWHRIWQWLSS